MQDYHARLEVVNIQVGLGIKSEVCSTGVTQGIFSSLWLPSQEEPIAHISLFIATDSV